MAESVRVPSSISDKLTVSDVRSLAKNLSDKEKEEMITFMADESTDSGPYDDPISVLEYKVNEAWEERRNTDEREYFKDPDRDTIKTYVTHYLSNTNVQGLVGKGKPGFQRLEQRDVKDYRWSIVTGIQEALALYFDSKSKSMEGTGGGKGGYHGGKRRRKRHKTHRTKKRRSSKKKKRTKRKRSKTRRKRR